MPRRRTRGSGSVFYDHAAGTWVALVSLGTRDGKRIRRKIRAHSQAAARTELDRLQRTYRRGMSASSETLDRYLRRWLQEHEPNIGKRTATSYRGHVENHISPLLGGIPVARLQPSDIRRLIAERLRAGVTPATVGHVLATLRIALNQGIRDRVLADNAMLGVKFPRVDREPVRAATITDIGKLREAIRGDQFEPLYLLLMGTGMRLGEACALDWSDIDLSAGSLFIRHGKTKRARRSVPLPEPVVSALREHRGRTMRIGPVFIGPRSGERLSVATISHAFPRLLRRAGLARMRVHDLRHGYATRALANRTDMQVIADILGHANPSTTANIYAHTVTEAQREAADKVGSELR